MPVKVIEANIDDLDPEMRLTLLWQTLRGFDTPKDCSLKDEYTFEQFLNTFASLSADVYLADQVRKQQAQQKEKKDVTG